jgi:uncharacterized protein
MDIDRDEIIRLSEDYGAAWGIHHTRRLLKLMSLIGAGQEYDQDAIWVAAYLHDWGGYAPWKQDGVHHAVRSRQVAEQFLRDRRYPDDFVAPVLEAIEFHHDPDPARGIAAILLCDADALDFLGTVGVLRNFSRFFQDMRRAYDDIQRRMATLPAALILETSRALAAERLPRMEQLLAAFEAETFGCF